MSKAVKSKMDKVKSRLKQKWVLLGLAGLAYTVIQKAGIQIPDETFRTIVDLAAYIVMGVGVYQTYEGEE